MALPASGPISSSQVATEFVVDNTNISLSNLGTKLSEPISAGNPVNLATSFYGQSGVTLTSFIALLNSEGNPFESSNEACETEETTSDTWYHNGSGTAPENGNAIYTNSGGTSSAPNGFFKYSPGRGFNTYQVANGVFPINAPVGIC